MEQFVLYGSGGHAKVVLESLTSEEKKVIGLFDDNPNLKEFKGIEVLGSYDSSILPDAKAIVTIGNNKIRKTISEKIGHRFGIARHVSSLVSVDAKIGEGSMVLQRAIIQSDAVVGKHVIVNTNAIVEHDCVIEDFVHLAPGAVVCGNSHIGEGTLIGANAVVGPNVKVGKWCQISAGSTVLNNYELIIMN